jgi:glycosyltransferase involved in cell wall biosynthesis
MKILYWTDFFLPNIGGIETFSNDLIPALQGRGCDITVVTSLHDPNLPTFEYMGSIPVYRLPTWESIRLNDLRGVLSVKKAVSALKRQLKPDLVHLHFGATAFFHLQTQAAASSPTLTTVHALPESSLGEKTLFSKVVHASHSVNTVSKVQAEMLARAYPQYAERFSHIYCGLNVPRHYEFDFVAPSFDEPVILCLGRLTPQKGFDLALNAFARIAPNFPAARMMIVGEGVEESALKDLAANLGIARRVEFTGAVQPKDVFEVINKATMILLPSRFEGLPIVALQAAYMQRPIISSNVDGLPDLVVDQESGLVLENNIEDGLVESIVSLLRHPQKAIRMGQAAAKRLERNFSFNDCVSRYEELYRKVVYAADDAKASD